MWSLAPDWLGYRIPRLQRFFDPPSLLLAESGRTIPANMRKELVTEDELMRQLRLRGLERLEQVERAYLEGDAGVSIIPRREAPPAEPVPPRRAFALTRGWSSP